MFPFIVHSEFESELALSDRSESQQDQSSSDSIDAHELFDVEIQVQEIAPQIAHAAEPRRSLRKREQTQQYTPTWTHKKSKYK